MMRPYHLVAPAPLVAQRSESAVEPVTPVTTTRLLGLVPNPTQAGAMVHFALAAAGDVELDLYSVTGQRVRRLGQAFGPGEHSVRWDGTDEGGHRVAPGMYFLKLRAAGVHDVRRILVTP